MSYRCSECGVVIALVGSSNSDPERCQLCVFAEYKTSATFWDRVAQAHRWIRPRGRRRR